ncbi:hypothetical protein [Wenxinia saemankumensis]|uniref:hypothetical protein n=1 Tax=Wenxinia saemankumensis TaxID=1447782 RepID=UPI0011150855|nr:hypothetical protein [Wenxinia saemankumensis]
MQKYLIIAAAAFLAAPATAQESGVTFELMGAEVQETTGAELGLGYRISSGGFNLDAAIGAFVYQGKGDDGYRYEASIDRCRDLSNGQFARDEFCDATEVAGYGRIEASYSFGQFEVGAGYRFSEDAQNPYGTATYEFGNGAGVKLNAGEDYLALGVVFRR